MEVIVKLTAHLVGCHPAAELPPRWWPFGPAQRPLSSYCYVGSRQYPRNPIAQFWPSLSADRGSSRESFVRHSVELFSVMWQQNGLQRGAGVVNLACRPSQPHLYITYYHTNY